MFPPLFCQNLFLVCGHLVEGLDDVRGLDTSRDPDLFLIVFKVSLLCAFSLEVEVEPFKKLTW